jgi:hypothetical protein
MKMTRNNMTKKLAVGAAFTLVLGAGAGAMLPSVANAMPAPQGMDDAVAHVRHVADDLNGASNSIAEVARRLVDVAMAEARQGADDPVGHVRHSGLDEAGELRHGADDVVDEVGELRHGLDDPIDEVGELRHGLDDAADAPDMDTPDDSDGTAARHSSNDAANAPDALDAPDVDTPDDSDGRL